MKTQKHRNIYSNLSGITLKHDNFKLKSISTPASTFAPTVLYEDDDLIAFRDINPVAPIHVLIIPKLHIDKLLSLSEKDKDLIYKIHKVSIEIAKKEGIAENGFRLVVNCNKEAGQSVFHLHYHLIGGRKLQWPPG